MTTLFAHRLNRDASFDSICITCYKTIASADSEGKLIAHEERHSCDSNGEFIRAQRGDSQRGTSTQASPNKLC